MPACSQCKFVEGTTCLNPANIQSYPSADSGPMDRYQNLKIPSPDWYCKLFEPPSKPPVDDLIELLGLSVTTDANGIEWVEMPWGPVERQRWRPDVDLKAATELMGVFHSTTDRIMSIAPSGIAGMWRIRDEFNDFEKRDISSQNLPRELTATLLRELRRFLGK